MRGCHYVGSQPEDGRKHLHTQRERRQSAAPWCTAPHSDKAARQHQEHRAEQALQDGKRVQQPDSPTGTGQREHSMQPVGASTCLNGQDDGGSSTQQHAAVAPAAPGKNRHRTCTSNHASGTSTIIDWAGRSLVCSCSALFCGLADKQPWQLHSLNIMLPDSPAAPRSPSAVQVDCKPGYNEQEAS